MLSWHTVALGLFGPKKPIIPVLAEEFRHFVANLFWRRQSAGGSITCEMVCQCWVTVSHLKILRILDYLHLFFPVVYPPSEIQDLTSTA
eukprot:scaffold185685_cov19-Prasinocladus_malaysianus.AAC.1